MLYTGDRNELSRILIDHLQCAILELPDEIEKIAPDQTLPTSFERIEVVYYILNRFLDEDIDELRVEHHLERLERLGLPPEV